MSDTCCQQLITFQTQERCEACSKFHHPPICVHACIPASSERRRIQSGRVGFGWAESLAVAVEDSNNVC